MNKSFVVFFAVAVALVSAGHLKEDLKPALAKLEPALQKIANYVLEHKSRFGNKDAPQEQQEEILDSVPEVPRPKVSDELVEEFREKPTSLKRIANLKAIPEVPQPEEDLEDDSDVLVSYGLDKPIKAADVVIADEKEGQEEQEDESADVKPIQDIDVRMIHDEDDSDVLVSYDLDKPIKAADEKESDEEEEDESADVKPLQDIDVRMIHDEEEEPADEDSDVMISFGLVEPIEVSALKNEDAEKDDDEEDEEKESKLVSGLVDTLIKKIAEIHDLKLE